MYINLGYLRGQMRLRNPEIVNNNDNIGSMLKHHRLKLKLTLEDSAEGICSISYLSKIENSLIRPSKKYILQLEEKYNTSFETVNSTHHEMLHQIIENMFYDVLELYDESLFDDDNYQTKLNGFGYYMCHKDYDNARIKLFELNPYIKNFNDLELCFYVYLTSKLLSSEGRLKDAFSILAISVDNVQNLFLKILIKAERFYLATKMHHHAYITIHFDNLLDLLTENEFYHKVHAIKFYYISYLASFVNEVVLEDFLSKTKHIQSFELSYLKAKHHYINMQYEVAYDVIKNQPIDDIGTYQLSLMTLNRMQNKKNLKDKLTEIPKIEDKHLQLVIKYLELKTQPKIQIETLVEFIKSNVLKLNDLPDDIDYLNFWYEEGHQYFKKVGYYKDATLLGHLIFRKMKDLNTIFD